MIKFKDQIIEIKKKRNRKFDKFSKKYKVSFVYVNYNNSIKYFDVGQDYDVLFEENKVNLAELKPGPPYVCQLLKPGEVKDKMSN